jgi:VRR-NUC domain
VTAVAPADSATWLLAQVSEAELQAFVVRTARLLGWRVFHPKFSIGSDSGWPDLTLVSPEQQRVVFAELKREGRWPTRTRLVNGRLRQGQAAWLETLMEAGQEVYLWWPSDRDDVATILQVGDDPDMPCLVRLRDFLREAAAIPGGAGG